MESNFSNRLWELWEVQQFCQHIPIRVDTSLTTSFLETQGYNLQEKGPAFVAEDDSKASEFISLLSLGLLVWNSFFFNL